jgi:hypothetical protein
MPGQHPDRELEQAAEQQRNRGEQADLPVAQRQVVPDERQRGALGAVDELIGELDGQRGRENRPGEQRLPGSKGHACHVSSFPV